MVSEFSVHAVPSNKKALSVVRGAIISSALCLIACFFIRSYQGIVSIVAVAFAAVAILFYTKYVTAEYIYEIINDHDGTALFVVRMRTGRRESTMLRLPLYSITSLSRECGEQMRKQKPDAKIPLYNYCPSFRPDSTVKISFRSRYDSADVYVEISDELCAHLSSLAEGERIAHPLDEE